MSRQSLHKRMREEVLEVRPTRHRRESTGTWIPVGKRLAGCEEHCDQQRGKRGTGAGHLGTGGELELKASKEMTQRWAGYFLPLSWKIRTSDAARIQACVAAAMPRSMPPGVHEQSVTAIKGRIHTC